MMDGVPMDPLTLWHVSGFDAFGKQVFLAPVNISGRWEDTAEEITDAKGFRIVSRGVIDVYGYSGDIEPGDFICRGRVYQMPSGTSGTPQVNSGAEQVKQVQYNRDFERRELSKTIFI